MAGRAVNRKPAVRENKERPDAMRCESELVPKFATAPPRSGTWKITWNADRPIGRESDFKDQDHALEPRAGFFLRVC